MKFGKYEKYNWFLLLAYTLLLQLFTTKVCLARLSLPFITFIGEKFRLHLPFITFVLSEKLPDVCQRQNDEERTSVQYASVLLRTTGMTYSTTDDSITYAPE